jgi:hypothetical protein
VSAPPKTVLAVAPVEAEAIRTAVRDPDLARRGVGRRVAGAADAAALTALFLDPAISDPIYVLGDDPRGLAGALRRGRRRRMIRSTPPDPACGRGKFRR